MKIVKRSVTAAVFVLGLSALAAMPYAAGAQSAPAAPADTAAQPLSVSPAAAPALQAPAPATAEIANPYGLGALWGQGDFIARFTLIALALMSASTWYILVTKLLEQSQLLRQAKRANLTFWKAGSVAEGVGTLWAPAFVQPARPQTAPGPSRRASVARRKANSRDE